MGLSIPFKRRTATEPRPRGTVTFQGIIQQRSRSTQGNTSRKYPGRYGDQANVITIRTTLQTFQPIWTNGGQVEFRYQVPKGFEVIGFMGSSGDFIDAIGIIARPRVHE